MQTASRHGCQSSDKAMAGVDGLTIMEQSMTGLLSIKYSNILSEDKINSKVRTSLYLCRYQKDQQVYTA